MAATAIAVASTNSDAISITSLSLPHPVLAPNVWGQTKPQPAYISLQLNLHGTFASAASLDVLDSSTVHYGELAKAIRGASEAQIGAGAMMARAAGCVRAMGWKERERRFVVRRARVMMRLPKAGMFAENGVVLVETTRWDANGDGVGRVEREILLEDVKVMTLVGVNACERTARQPVVVGAWVKGEWNADVWEGLFRLEQMLAQVIEATSFETLESLAEHTIKELREQILDQAVPGAQIRLKLAKPRAIAFADAPAVEIVREVSGQVSAAPGDGSRPVQLYIVKPYVTKG